VYDAVQIIIKLMGIKGKFLFVFIQFHLHFSPSSTSLFGGLSPLWNLAGLFLRGHLSEPAAAGNFLWVRLVLLHLKEHLHPCVVE
jgi:hypothetical protein